MFSLVIAKLQELSWRKLSGLEETSPKSDSRRFAQGSGIHLNQRAELRATQGGGREYLR